MSHILVRMLVCSLLDLAGLPIDDKLLEDIGILREAYGLEHKTLYRSCEGTWNTMHPRWDEELLSFLYNENDKPKLSDRKRYLRNAIDLIFKVKEEKVTYAVIASIYDIAARKVIPIELVESVIQIPNHISKYKRTELYAYYAANTYITLGKFHDAIQC